MTQTISLTIPAAAEHVALLRSTAAAVGAKADLTLDQIEDMRLAVDEAASHVIADASPQSRIDCSFAYSDGVLDIVISGPTKTGRVPETSSFGWTVLTALADRVSADANGNQVTIELHLVRPIAIEL
jgi:serine/threonine-protein kinase RsbW